jgi:hypothetical protein
MMEKSFERNVLGAVNAEEKEIEQLIIQQDTRIIFALRERSLHPSEVRARVYATPVGL